MVKKCSVPLCEGVASKENNVRLYKFPACDCREMWLQSIKSYYPNFKISNSSNLVCSKHFAEADFIQKGRSKTLSLSARAVPSLFRVNSNDCKRGSSFNNQLQVTPKRNTYTAVKTKQYRHNKNKKNSIPHYVPWNEFYIPKSRIYCKNWEKEDMLKGWLTKSKKGEEFFHCKLCNIDKPALRSNVEFHASRSEHKALLLKKQQSWSIVSKKTICYVLLGLFIYHACIKKT